MRVKSLIIICLTVFLSVQMSFASNEMISTKKDTANLNFSGYMFIQAGEVEKGFAYMGGAGELSKQWMEQACIGLFASETIDKHLKVLMGIEGNMAFSFRQLSFATGYSPQPQYVPTTHSMTTFTIAQGEGIYSFGDPKGNALQIEAGYFPYKYNPDVRNLGEYMFRTMCYPTIMRNLPDRTYTELLGFRVGNTINGNFHQDIILNSETKDYPLYDATVAYLADYSLPNIFTVGGGVSLYRVLAVDKKLTAPTTDSKNDTILNPFSGTKVMGRASFDVKGLIPMPFLGKEDLKIYTETALLGTKNYSYKLFPHDSLNTAVVKYDKLSQRCPITIGFNFPTFKLLDVLNLEVEYLNSPYVNTLDNAEYNLIPLPNPELNNVAHTKYKWSVYAKKTIGSKLVLSGQVSNDHFIPQSFVGDETIADYTDITYRHGDWWWMFRVRFDF